MFAVNDGACDIPKSSNTAVQHKEQEPFLRLNHIGRQALELLLLREREADPIKHQSSPVGKTISLTPTSFPSKSQIKLHVEYKLYVMQSLFASALLIIIVWHG